MSRLDFYKANVEVNDELLRGIVLLVGRNYMKQRTSVDAITIQECTWVLDTALSILKDFTSKLVDQKEGLSTIFTWTMFLDDEANIVIMQRNAKTKYFRVGHRSFVGVTSWYETDINVMKNIWKSIVDISSNINKLKRKLDGHIYLGTDDLNRGNIVNYLPKVKYILEKLK